MRSAQSRSARMFLGLEADQIVGRDPRSARGRLGTASIIEGNERHVKEKADGAAKFWQHALNWDQWISGPHLPAGLSLRPSDSRSCCRGSSPSRPNRIKPRRKAAAPAARRWRSDVECVGIVAGRVRGDRASIERRLRRGSAARRPPSRTIIEPGVAYGRPGTRAVRWGWDVTRLERLPGVHRLPLPAGRDSCMV